MSTSQYLENYLDSLRQLPQELQRNFRLMRDLDQRGHSLLREIDFSCDTIFPKLSLTDTHTRDQELENIQTLFNRAREYCDDKVQLAIQTYELVDKHIRRLDSDMAKYDSEIQEKAKNLRAAQLATRELENPGKGKSRKKHKNKISYGKKKQTGAASDDDSDSKTSVSTKRYNRKASAVNDEDTDSKLSETIHSSDVLDMPVDPNEPTYCLCSQVSYGNMIGCDNANCEIEWFHFNCVKLTVKPKGKWYCPKCSSDRKKK